MKPAMMVAKVARIEAERLTMMRQVSLLDLEFISCIIFSLLISSFRSLHRDIPLLLLSSSWLLSQSQESKNMIEAGNY